MTVGEVAREDEESGGRSEEERWREYDMWKYETKEGQKIEVLYARVHRGIKDFGVRKKNVTYLHPVSVHENHSAWARFSLERLEIPKKILTLTSPIP